MKAFSFVNIVQGNGVGISITGMAIVFSGLIIMSVFIQLLPKVLNLWDRKSKDAVPEKPAAAPAMEKQTTEAPSVANVAEDDEKDIASLIGLILHLENERLYQADNQYITINRDGTRQSMWGRSGQMRETPQRRGYAKV